MTMDPWFHPDTKIGQLFRRFQDWSLATYKWPWPLFKGSGLSLTPRKLPVTVVGKHYCYGIPPDPCVYKCSFSWKADNC